MQLKIILKNIRNALILAIFMFCKILLSSMKMLIWFRCTRFFKKVVFVRILYLFVFFVSLNNLNFQTDNQNKNCVYFCSTANKHAHQIIYFSYLLFVFTLTHRAIIIIQIYLCTENINYK